VADRPPATDGLVVIDKAPGWTSHDVVAKCRGIFGQKKVGHSGTLDPDATGVLLVGLGRVTRLLRFLTALPKSYVGEVVFGTATSTLDSSGEVVATFDMAVSLEDVRGAATGLTGDIEQVPPMVSAVKVGGKRLHELARAGEEVERAARPVHVSRLDVAPTDDPLVYRIEVDCSSGTYIRTLAADLGEALGGGAHLRNLRRTAIGSFTVEQAAWLDTDLPVLSPAEALRDYPAVTLSAEGVVAVRQGKRVDLPAETSRVLDPEGNLVAVAEAGRTAVVLSL
jgi:tRNA pseudouridine55 synthase